MTPTALRLAMRAAASAGPGSFVPPAATRTTVAPLAEADAREVLEFLAERPVHTVNMAGPILDNGVVSPLNRGGFHACRDSEGRLEGVALIGHAVLVEARTERAAAAFAGLAKKYSGAHLILGEEQAVELFMRHYAEGGRQPRRLCRELLLEQRWPVEVRGDAHGLRQATPRDLEAVVPVHARLAYEESGVDPLVTDPDGFRRRAERRVERGRVWVATDERGRLLFKADVTAETPQCVYLEGVFVAPEARGRGYGLACMSRLTHTLLRRAGSVCLLVNERNASARAFYRRAGYRQVSAYDTIFLGQ